MLLTLLKCTTSTILNLLQLQTIAQHRQQTPRGLEITLIPPCCTGHCAKLRLYMKAEPDMVATYNKRYEEAMILAQTPW
jgi:hypothetical protein